MNVAGITLTLVSGEKICTQLKFSDTQLNINDTFIRGILVNGGIGGNVPINTCSIALGSHNLAVIIENYKLTDTLSFSAFYDMPSKISLFQSHGTSVQISNQKIDLLQLDCPSAQLTECQVRQLDLGLAERLKILRQVNVDKEDASIVYKTHSLVLRECDISALKCYTVCDSVNIHGSSIRSLCFIGDFGSTTPAVIKQLNIWEHSEIRVFEIYCTVEELSLKNSLLSIFIAKSKSRLLKLEVTETEIISAYNFEKKHFGKVSLDAWSLISKSARNNRNSSLKAEADYQIIKTIYKQEKGLNRIAGAFFSFCTGYGYKPMRILWAFIVLIGLACVAFSVTYCFLNKCFISTDQFLYYLVTAVAAIAGQSGLSIADGFDFWVAAVEYLLGIILFAMFVNALFVRYKE